MISDLPVVEELGSGVQGRADLVRDDDGILYVRKLYFHGQAAVPQHEAEAHRRAAEVLPYVVPTLYHADKDCLLMEYAEGEPVSAWAPPVEPAHLRVLLLVVGEWLALLHEAGIHYRDLKGAHILADRNRRPRHLLDFGVAHLEGRPDPFGDRLVTPYAAVPPEALTNGHIDLASVDMFGLGTLTTALSIGQLGQPMVGAPDTVVRRRHLREGPRTGDADLDEIIRQLLTPDRRLSARGLLQRLAPSIAHGGRSDASLQPLPTSSAMLSPPSMVSASPTPTRLVPACDVPLRPLATTSEVLALAPKASSPVVAAAPMVRASRLVDAAPPPPSLIAVTIAIGAAGFVAIGLLGVGIMVMVDGRRAQEPQFPAVEEARKEEPQAPVAAEPATLPPQASIVPSTNPGRGTSAPKSSARGSAPVEVCTVDDLRRDDQRGEECRRAMKECRVRGDESACPGARAHSAWGR